VECVVCCRSGPAAGVAPAKLVGGPRGEHAILRVGPRSIDLHAIGGEVRVGGEVIAKDYGCALRPAIDLTIGEARLRISVERAHAPARNSVERGDASARSRISVAILAVRANWAALGPESSPNRDEIAAPACQTKFSTRGRGVVVAYRARESGERKGERKGNFDQHGSSPRCMANSPLL
jgi:hypothetical protein